MRKISIRQLHLDTGRWVRRAAGREAVVITDRRRPVATLAPFDQVTAGRSLPDREARIRRRRRLSLDSGRLISEMRDRT